MRLFFASLALALGVLTADPAVAQFQPVLPMCGDPPAPCSAANPLPVDASSGSISDVNLTEVAGAAVKTGAGTAAGSIRVELPTDGTGKVGLNAGSAIIGKVGIDQTTPGTTNAVSATNFPSTVSTGAGAVGASAPRVSVGQDATTIAGAAPGTAGTASDNVVTIQGIAAMTKLLVTPDANAAVNLGQVGGTSTVNGGLAGTLGVGGATATNVAITDNPLNLGAQAVSSENAAATTARKVQLVADLVGKQIVLPYANPENFVSGTTAAMTGTTSTSLIPSPGGSLRNYITSLTCVNSHATVGTFVTVQDGSGGTALMTVAAASLFGGSTITMPTPLRQPTAATALHVANVTTGANVICSATGYKGL